MKRIQKILVVAILSLVMLGCGLTTTVSAVKPPFMPPGFEGYPGHPDALRVFFAWDGNVIHSSDPTFILSGWAYYVDEAEPVDETELFPQPIRFQAWIKSSSGDWCEIKLSRHSIGNAAAIFGDPHFVGPLYRWYAYFEPYTFDAGVYETHVTYTCKDPNNPSERMVCWNTLPGPDYGRPLDYYGLLTVLDG
ncbi:MAG: hypothetical protein ACFFEF_15570 [Candidatus Thorarchaeota archaeon]